MQKVFKTHTILTPTHVHPTITPHALQIRRAPAHQSISLQTLIILPQLRELTQRVPGRRALGTT
jgi:hypothetical protein